MGAPDNPDFWNRAANSRRIPSDDIQKNLLREFKRVMRPGGLLLISYGQFADELDGYGRFRLPDGEVLRHHSREWFEELLAGFCITESLELDAQTMNGNPTRILQLWART